ncbi:hypothetical protein [Paenibacillus sp. MMS20-IR301]|uniref:hypothetical protein n=1 Tax=Paenibacillus sp. MMS20-IR301 TaxID=2895946 RepID=UPI0028E8ED51|nr:hypothetical protein [Paenibacillus sp. MMS20-IR301]WNS41505.1 hypothetical protein LOS79_21090 [Paenibacillus sp. MMS20-IR301]
MDKQARKILMNTFWTSAGWKGTPSPFTGDDFDYAKSKGLMFDPVTITHDGIIERLHELHGSITKERVAAAFLHSLSTKKVHLRSALSSWALTSSVPVHTYEQRSVVRPNYSSCGDCNFHRLMSDRDYGNEDLNVLNFERVKWGGIRLNWLVYCWMDLELFSKEEPVESTAEDVAILSGMLEAVQDCGDYEGARMLEKRWKDIVPSSKNERDVLMEIWGYAGILVPLDTPRKRRGGSSDYESVAEWQGNDRYSREAVEHYFGAFL